MKVAGDENLHFGKRTRAHAHSQAHTESSHRKLTQKAIDEQTRTEKRAESAEQETTVEEKEAEQVSRCHLHHDCVVHNNVMMFERKKRWRRGGEGTCTWRQ